MRAPFIPRVRADAFGRAPRDDEDLGRLARGYAKDELAGRVQVNHPTQLGIALTPRALAEATRPGAPAALLRAIPALPRLSSMLSTSAPSTTRSTGRRCAG